MGVRLVLGWRKGLLTGTRFAALAVRASAFALLATVAGLLRTAAGVGDRAHAGARNAQSVVLLRLEVVTAGRREHERRDEGESETLEEVSRHSEYSVWKERSLQTPPGGCKLDPRVINGGQVRVARIEAQSESVKGTVHPGMGGQDET